jgi:hypothetical protein
VREPQGARGGASEENAALCAPAAGMRACLSARARPLHAATRLYRAAQ